MSPWFPALVLMLSGVAKMFDFAWFVGHLQSFNVPAAGVVAICVICTELVCGLLLVTSKERLPEVRFLAISFVALLSLALIWGHLVVGVNECGCFGRFASMSVEDALIRNVLLIAALMTVVVPKQRSV